MIYHAEVTEDSDGPVEWCWPVPGDQAAAIAVGDALYRWTLEQHRKPNGGPRMILIGVPSAGDPPGRGPDFDLAVALR